MKPNIVIVDDDPDIINLLTYSFSKKGNNIFAFESSKEAFHHIANHKPDLIISDWMMPDLDGVQLCRLIAIDPVLKTIPFIFLTCKDDKRDKETAWEAGATEFVTKPVKINDLLEKVQKILARNQLPY